ncbi:hypothetical protein HQ586_08590 [Candidatus Bathyarchaeota archaeon]|nr:hypothetical protein [Candidatus Bathyarchaeota archaeon]
MSNALKRLMENLRGPRQNPGKQVLLRRAPVEMREIGDVHDMLLFRYGIPERE